MAMLPQPSLFCWHDIEAGSDLDRLRLVLHHLPDEELMRQLEAARGQGRDDYPIRAVWNAYLAGVVFQHPSKESLSRELRRNAELRQVCGFDLSRGAEAVPTSSAWSRFESNLLDHEPEMRAIVAVLVDRLGVELDDLGQYLGVDSKALASYGRPGGEGDDRRTERDADWGVKTIRRERPDGQVVEKQTRWFGFKLHLLVDTVYELPLGYEVTRASVADTTRLLPLVEHLERRHPELLGRARELAADKAYDCRRSNAGLWDQYRIKPVIDKKADWRDDPAGTRPLAEKGWDTAVYDVRGRVWCVAPGVGPEAPVTRPMAFWGFEAERGCLKYRCPLAARGQECPQRERCPGAEGKYGKVVRVPLARDRRLFVPIPRDTPGWDKAYARRSAVERVNSRIDRVLGFEQHTIRGLTKMKVAVGVGLAVMLAMALGRVREGDGEHLRSMLRPVRRAGP